MLLSLARRELKDKFPTPTIPLTAVLPNCQAFLPDPVYRLSVYYGRFFSLEAQRVDFGC
jgi:hypothetical protein